MNNTKQCSKCKEIKPLTEFYKNKTSKGGLRPRCKSCQRQYREANKEKRAEYDKQYREANKEKIVERSRQYYEANKEKIVERSRQYYEANKEKIAEREKRYYEANKEKITKQKKQYREANKEKITEYKRRYTKEREANDPAYRLRRRVASRVWRILKSQGKRKGGSTFEHLPYTPEELKEHIESLWEPWMDWDNWGTVSKERRTWQVDHIIPQSHLIYDSLQHPNFQKCWALSNLRPVCAWENLEKRDKLFFQKKLNE